jgi:glycosyltransferase involved in cell wall biosynthesis
LRILIHDFAGHPFQVQLSRELALRGHSVLHLAAGGLPGPKGPLCGATCDPPELLIRSVPLSGLFQKYSFCRRLIAQRQYAADLVRIVHGFRPDVVLSGNAPTDVQARILRYCHSRHIGFVHWVQDVYSHAIAFVLRPKFGHLTALPVAPFRWLDRWVARTADGVVAISPGFQPVLRQWGVRPGRLTIVENWAPLEEMPVRRRQNAWSEAQGLNGQPVLLYAGTLGLKHRPDLIYTLAQQMAGQARVVVVSEGVGREYLENRPQLANLTLLDFQPYWQVPDVLASADVLLATLEGDAGEFAVPSKVLAYLCAGRPVLLSAPMKNLASEVVARSGGGVVVAPNDSEGWLRSARSLASDQSLRRRLGTNARRYAESTFNIVRIADRFETLLTCALERAAVRAHSPHATSLAGHWPVAVDREPK